MIEMNREALEQLRVEKELEIVPEATHLFEEPGALEQVARLASGWFVRRLHSITDSSIASGGTSE